MLTIRKSNERGQAHWDWLETYHTFSFADYYDARWMGFGTLRVLNDDRVAPGRGFGMHPHRDMEIITYVLSGALEHKDSMGNGRVLRAGEFQYMSAGRGVMHSEFNPSSTDPVHLLQIWLLPDEKGATPRYAEAAAAPATPAGLQLVASKGGHSGSIAIRQDADLWLARLDAGKTARHALAPGRQAWVHVAEGGIRLNGQTLHAGDGAGIEQERALELVGDQPSQVLLFDLR